MFLWICTFAAFLAFEFAYVRMQGNMVAKHRWRAGLWSGLCVLISYGITIVCVEDHTLLIPACLAAVFGPPLAIRK